MFDLVIIYILIFGVVLCLSMFACSIAAEKCDPEDVKEQKGTYGFVLQNAVCAVFASICCVFGSIVFAGVYHLIILILS